MSDITAFRITAAAQCGVRRPGTCLALLNGAQRHLWKPVVLLLMVSFASGCTSSRVLLYEVGRDMWQQPDRVVSTLGIQPGCRVADLGSGGGYFTARLCRAAGSEGKVFAVDVDKEMNAYLSERVSGERTKNVTVILGRMDDPLLPESGVDLVVSVNAYHCMQNRPAYFRNLRRCLAPGGRVAVIDFDGRLGMQLIGRYTPRDVLMREMTEAGYELVESHDFIDRQSFVIFRPKAAESPAPAAPQATKGRSSNNPT